MNNRFFNDALNESFKAEKKQSVPVGAVLVKNNKIISRAHNINYKSNMVIDHAEIICIKKAVKKSNDWRLDDFDMYVTLEPCDMCKEVIKASRIKNVFYLLPKNSKVCKQQTKFIKAINVTDVDTKLGENKLKSFFKKLRQK